MIPEKNAQTARILKEDIQAFYGVFKQVLGEQTIMTRAMRAEILEEWQKLKPLSPMNNLRTELCRFEQKYWASFPAWEKQALITKITQEGEELKSDILASKTDIIRKAVTINKINQTTAQVNSLQSQPPPATIMINTNIDESDLIKQLNTIPEGDI